MLVGMGNPILSDDAVGVRLARDLKRSLEGAPGLDVVEECSVGGLNILDVVSGYDRLLLIDSIRTAGGVPGSWYRFTARSLRETMNLRNVHDANFATALAFGRRMGMKLPADGEIHIFAVEVSENATFSETMSQALEAAYAELSAEILREIRELLFP